MLHLGVVWKSDFSQQVKSQGREDDDPNGEENVPVQDAPVVDQVGDGKELEGQGQLEEAQDHFHGIQPAPRLGKALQPFGEDGKQGKGNGEGQAEGEHA